MSTSKRRTWSNGITYSLGAIVLFIFSFLGLKEKAQSSPISQIKEGAELTIASDVSCVVKEKKKSEYIFPNCASFLD